MTRTLLTSLLLLAMLGNAQACHRFHVWHYAWPQSCGVSIRYAWHAPRRVAVVAAAPRSVESDPSKDAIDKLRAAMLLELAGKVKP